MAFKPKNLNNIAGSLGMTNVWIYEDEDETKASIAAADFFTPAKAYNMKPHDIIFVNVSDGVGPGRIDEGTTAADLQFFPISIY